MINPNTDNKNKELEQEYRNLIVNFDGTPETANRMSEIEQELDKTTEELCREQLNNYSSQY